MTLRLRRVLAFCLIVGSATSAIHATPTPGELLREGAAAMQAGAYDRAVTLYTDLAALESDSFVPRYNLACAHAAAGDLREAQSQLARAVELGFASYTTLTTDPDLAPLRATGLYRKLVANWPAILDARRRAANESVRGWLSRKPWERELAPLRLDVLSTLDEHATARAVREIERAAAWTLELIPDLKPASGEVEERTDRFDAWAQVILMGDEDFRPWLVHNFGPAAGRRGNSYIGGVYEHDRKRLIAQDVGATLRHELFHALHTRHTERLGQTHPIWIQEGLASLLEDIDPAGESWAPAPSFRTNIVKRLAGMNRLSPLREIATLDQKTFVRSRPLKRYAEARAVFLYLHEIGALSRWYEVYTTEPDHGYAADPSGLTAIARVAGGTLDDFEAAWRAWAKDDLPMVAEEMDDLDITLGLRFSAGSGDGPQVIEIDREVRRATDLRLGAVVLSVNGRPTGDVRELARVLGGAAAGDTVRIEYRQGRLYREASVPVRAK